ncbi:MAG: Omp28-related outer membrane protein [Bacteroidota bacterium]
MRQLFFLSVSFLLTTSTFAQEAKRYLLVEHFTNSRCGICSSRNPAMYTAISPHAAEVHHIAYHPSFPYSSCVFYQHNKDENQARATFYGVPGTPTAYLWGNRVSSGSSLLPSTTLSNALSQTSPIDVIVTEELGGAGRDVSIKVKTVGQLSEGGDYRLFVAVVEKLVNYDAPNGEKEHHDVFRKMLPSSDGESFVPAAEGGEMSFSFNYSFHTDWDITQVYAIAFVQDMNSKEVMNSGSTLDSRASTSIDPVFNEQIAVYPNPAHTQFQLDWSGISGSLASIQLFSTTGQSVLAKQVAGREGKATLDVSSLPKGMYFLQIELDGKYASRKVSVE